MLIATHKEWEAATILTSMKDANLVRLKKLNKYGRIISSGHGFYTVKVIDSLDIIKRRRNQLIFL